MRKIYLKGIAFITSAAICFTGVTFKKSVKADQYNNEKYFQSKSVVDNNEEILNFFKNGKEELISYIESEEFTVLKEKGKNYLTMGIDFIFFDKQINGIYFKELKEESKKQVLHDMTLLDEAITAYFPDYKETISNKYKVASEFINEEYLSLMSKIKAYLGEENYEAIGEIKNQLKNDISDKFNEAKSFVLNLYTDWKNK